MLMKKLVMLFAVITAFFVVSCGGSSTPSDAAVDFYQLVADGKYEAAADCIAYAKDKEEESKAMVIALFKEKVDPQLEKNEGLKSVEAVSEKIAEDGNSAVVEMKIIYGNGKEEVKKVDMVLDGGEWKPSMNK